MRFNQAFFVRLAAIPPCFGRCCLTLAALWGGILPEAGAQAHRITSASPGLIEAGVPTFAVLGAESLGLNSAPTDIRLMPDGRILVVAAQQLALGDGVRWEVFRQAPTDLALSSLGGAVDEDGEIYLGVAGGGARVNFGEDGLWRLAPTGLASPGSALSSSVPHAVTVAGNEWFWHSSSGPIISWRPGQAARTVGQADTFEGIFLFDGVCFLSDRTEGRLSLIRPDGSMETVQESSTLSAITCTQPYDKNLLLVGTYGLGLRLFDGRTLRPFPASSLLTRGNRINDLCATDGGLFAAAVDNYGVVFFTREGKAVQVLDRSLDHRLSGVKRLLPAAGGVIWGLLDGGVLRIGFPSGISNFEPLIGAGVTTVHPYRLDGRLWLLADGKIYEGKYDSDGRLAGLEIDSPKQVFVSTFSVAAGLPVAGTEQGAFFRGASGWMPFAPAANHLRIIDPKPISGRWLYSAQNEIGWLQAANGGIEISERLPVPALSRVYNAVGDRLGRSWLELGSGRVGRIQLMQGRPSLEILAEGSGVPPSWAQIFSLDGDVRFNFSEHILRFDETSRRLVPDENFATTLPGLNNIIGRPGMDARGRLWITANGMVHRLEKQSGHWRQSVPPMDVGFQPYYYTFESEGVVWMHGLHRLARFDPAMPHSSPVPLRALITHVNVATSNRSLFALDRELPPLDFSENSIIAHFVASGNPIATPVTFEVSLEGSIADWISVGSAGSASFNRLKEGRYVLHVRPRSGTVTGMEATLAFSIRPPWYRTTIAYLAFGLSALGAVLLAVWLSTLLERRENARLERLVAERTGELSQSNLQLANQVEEIRILTQAIVQSPIAVFITTTDGTIEFINPRSSELTGHAATELIGLNLRQLRAPEVTVQQLGEISRVLEHGDSWSGQLVNRLPDGQLIHVRSTASPILSPDGQIRHHLVLEEDITEWLAGQQRHRRLEAQLTQAQKMESIGTLAGGIAHDFNNILTGILGYCELAHMAADDKGDVRDELQQIRAAGLRAKDLVMQILTFSRQSPTKRVPLDLSRPVAEALKLIRASIPATIEIVQNLESGTVLADATQIHQIIVNLCTNAVHAIKDRPGRLVIALQNVVVDERLAGETPNLKPGPALRLTVADNGHGMDQATLERIFDPFFTTKLHGEGTGLGLAIVQGVVVSHGGAIQVSSRPGYGTTFELFFPLTGESVPSSASDREMARGSGQEILLVDDEPLVTDFAVTRLQHFGYRPVVFNDPRAALEAFNATPSRFAALVTDLTMPHLTGLDLLNHIRPLRPLIPAVVLTGYGREHTREKLAALPHCVLLQKPFSGEDLAHALSQVMSPSHVYPKPGAT